MSKFNNNYNKPIIEEFIILIMGPLVQIIFYFILIRFNLFNKILLYNCNFSILIFNLLPIYPLDGGKLINLIFNKFLCYRISGYLITVFSVFNILLFIYITYKYNLGLNLVLLLVFLLFKLYSFYKNIKINYNSFLLDRYLNNYKFKKNKTIKNKNNFYRDNFHYILSDNKYISEKEFLKKIYKKH